MYAKMVDFWLALATFSCGERSIKSEIPFPFYEKEQIWQEVKETAY